MQDSYKCICDSYPFNCIKSCFSDCPNSGIENSIPKCAWSQIDRISYYIRQLYSLLNKETLEMIKICICSSSMIMVFNLELSLSGWLGWIPTNSSEEANVSKGLLQWLLKQTTLLWHRLWELFKRTRQVHIQNNSCPSETVRHRPCTNSLCIELWQAMLPTFILVND